MAQLISRGATITLDAFYRDANGDAVTPTSPLIDIVDAAGTTVVNNAVPTSIGLGHYEYAYPVAADAPLGAWEARWSGLINGAPVEAVEGFTVIAAGSISVPVGGGGGATCSPWATSADALAPCDDYAIDATELDLCMQFASDVLYQFTRRKYRGICVDEVYPNARYRASDSHAWWPIVGGDRWRWGFCSCHRTDEYGCSSIPQLRLPGFPVDPASIVVTIAGDTFTDWELRDHRKLVRTDGEGWPCCQPLPLDDQADGGWSVRYQYGVDPPQAGKRAAAVLGCQLYNAFNPEMGRTCQLPQRVTNVTRSGVTIGAILDPLELFDKGKTGLPSVDMWVSADRYGDRQTSAVIVPGRGRGVTRIR